LSTAEDRRGEQRLDMGAQETAAKAGFTGNIPPIGGSGEKPAKRNALEIGRRVLW